MDKGAYAKIKVDTVDLEKWSPTAKSWRSHPVQGNLDVTSRGHSLLPSDQSVGSLWSPLTSFSLLPQSEHSS